MPILESRQQRTTKRPSLSSIALRFLKQVAIEVPITSDYRQTVIGSKWLFRFAAGSNLVRFALDVGLGEHNSLGFGFMNVQSSTGGMNNN